MLTPAPTQRAAPALPTAALRIAALALCLALAATAPCADAASHKATHVTNADTAGAFDHAERMREALEGRPEGQRTRRVRAGARCVSCH